MSRKKKILFVSEAAYLNTGYAKYSKEVLDRLNKSGKYEIAEFSIYGGSKDPRRKTIPWKNYANMPEPDNEEEMRHYSSNSANQFGAWRFERVCLEFKPDIVFTIRDFWMDSFIYHSAFRRIFSWAWMPTVDSSPQNQEWIDMFKDADYVLTYSQWARELLDKQSGKKINTIGVASPSASDCFLPMDKKNIRNHYEIDPNIKIIGTVMRNQRRKLFPSLFEAFGKYIHEANIKDTYLYIHTSFPDAGWNLAQMLHDNKISSRVLMTYVCSQCQHIEVCNFSDHRKMCQECRKYSSAPASVSNGIPDKALSEIYNLFDLYIQCANSEGFGLPQVEAAACGIPLACTNYSAMQDLVDNVNAYPISYYKYKELETGCDRAVPDIDSIVNVFKDFFSKTSEEQKQISTETRKLFLKNYNWDNTAEQWMKIADDCDYADWDQPISQITPREVDIKEPSTYKFIDDLLENHVYYEPHKKSYFARSLITDLKRGMSKTVWDGYYVSEFSPYSSNKLRNINREDVVKVFQSRLRSYNIWEQARVDPSVIKDKDELWIKQN